MKSKQAQAAPTTEMESIMLVDQAYFAISTIFKRNTNFLFNRTDLKIILIFLMLVFKDQIDGVALASALAPILTNLFIGFLDESWLWS